jgi:hypothetical protein
MEHEAQQEDRPRLDVEEFIQMYLWMRATLDEEVAEHLDEYVVERLPAAYPDDVAELYSALAAAPEHDMRALAAIGLHTVFSVHPEAAARIAARLLDDTDEAVAAQTRATLQDLPELLGDPDRPQTPKPRVL